MKLRHRSVTAAALFCGLMMSGGRTHAGPAQPAAKHEWDYGQEHGPQHWGDLKPEFAACKVGHRQSPVDIQGTQKADLPAIQFDYQPSPLRIVDNGHTIQVTYAAGSSIRVGEARYELKQFHFHRPSEARVHGRSYDMELHLVHEDEAGHLAVVAVLLEHGHENPLVRELWKDVPREKEKEALLEAVRIDAAQLLPSDRGYYTFDGSLTTPPCSEDVTWFVLKRPVQISADEVAQFAKLYPRDARPTQPLHGRVVRETR
jgi:carbonic anhydrase